MKKIGLFSLTMILTLTLAACGGQQSKKNDSTDTSTKEKADSTTPVNIKAVGSTALQPLVEQVAEIYMTDHPNYTISVQGGGSGTGLSQVDAGAVEIGNSDIFAEEKDGVDAKKIEDHQIAVVGIAPVVNKDIGVENVSQDELKKIFTGKITNWKEIGGKDETITLINRASGSGTRATFEKWALDGESAAQSQEQDSSGTVKKIVSETPGAISYLAFSYIDKDLLSLKVDNIEPTPENVATNKWKIWSYEHMYTAKDAKPEIKTFIEYILTKDVQKNVVEKLNYIPITNMKVQRSVDGKLTQK